MLYDLLTDYSYDFVKLGGPRSKASMGRTWAPEPWFAHPCYRGIPEVLVLRRGSKVASSGFSIGTVIAALWDVVGHWFVRRDVPAERRHIVFHN